MPTLGKLIRRRRLELGLSQEQLADLVGEHMRQAEISRLENDHVSLPRRERLERLAEALDVPLGELLARSGWTGADEFLRPAEPPSLTVLEPPTLRTPEEKLEQIENILEQAQTLATEVRADLGNGVPVASGSTDRADDDSLTAVASG